MGVSTMPGATVRTCTKCGKDFLGAGERMICRACINTAIKGETPAKSTNDVASGPRFPEGAEL